MTNTQELKRYSVVGKHSRDAGTIVNIEIESTSGEWVRYDDLQSYIAQIKADAVRDAAESVDPKNESEDRVIYLLEDYADKLQRDSSEQSSSGGGV